MNLSRSRGGLAAAGLLALIAGAALPTAHAHAQHGSYGAHRSDGTRGVVTLGDHHGEFYFHGSPTTGLVAYFVSCGYDAWCEKGIVYVRYHGRRPCWSITAPGYAFSISYSRGCAVIKPRCLAPPRVRHVERVYRPKHVRRASRQWCPPAPQWRHHRGPRWGSHPGPRWGWSISIGSKDHGHRYRGHRSRGSRCR